MTIEEKAREYVCYYMAFSQDTVTDVSASSDYSAFMAGARWMIEKAVKRYSSDIDEINNLLGFIDEKAAGLIDKEKSIEKFRKSMEE